jgi:hypothetical protein
VVAASEDADFVWLHLIHQAMLLIDPPGPAPGQLVFKRFRLAKTGKGLTLCFANEADNPKRLRPILLDPPRKILKRRNVKFQASQ